LAQQSLPDFSTKVPRSDQISWITSSNPRWYHME
jgi:hypothetical protein